MYDPKCYSLAEMFLEDHISEDMEDLRRHTLTEQLAQVIQDAIEDEIDAMKSENADGWKSSSYSEGR